MTSWSISIQWVANLGSSYLDVGPSYPVPYSFSGGYGGYGGDPIYGLNRWDHIILDVSPSLRPGCVDTYFYDIVTGTYRSGKVCGS